MIRKQLEYQGRWEEDNEEEEEEEEETVDVTTDEEQVDEDNILYKEMVVDEEEKSLNLDTGVRKDSIYTYTFVDQALLAIN